VTSVRSNNLC